MSGKLLSFLKSCECEKYLEKFQNSKISVEKLLDLSKDDLVDLIEDEKDINNFLEHAKKTREMDQIATSPMKLYLKSGKVLKKGKVQLLEVKFCNSGYAKTEGGNETSFVLVKKNKKTMLKVKDKELYLGITTRMSELYLRKLEYCSKVRIKDGLVIVAGFKMYNVSSSSGNVHGQFEKFRFTSSYYEMYMK